MKEAKKGQRQHPLDVADADKGRNGCNGDVKQHVRLQKPGGFFRKRKQGKFGRYFGETVLSCDWLNRKQGFLQNKVYRFRNDNNLLRLALK